MKPNNSERNTRQSTGLKSVSAMIVVTIYCLLFFSSVLYFSAIGGQVKKLVMAEAKAHNANLVIMLANKVNKILNEPQNLPENSDEKLQTTLIQAIGSELSKDYKPFIGDIVIFNESGVILYPSGNNSINMTLLDDIEFWQWTENKNTSETYASDVSMANQSVFSFDADEKTLSISPIGNTSLFIALDADSGFLIWKAQNFESGLFVAMVITFSIAIVLFMLLLRLIMSPLKVLTDAVQRLGRGELSTRVDIGATNEIGVLGRSFNDMAADLESKYFQIESYSQQLESMNEETKRTMSILAKRNQELGLINQLSYEGGKHFNFQENIDFLVEKVSKEYNPLFTDVFMLDDRARQWRCLKSSPDNTIDDFLTDEFSDFLFEIAENDKTRIITGKSYLSQKERGIIAEELLVFPVKLSAGSMVIIILGSEAKSRYSSREIVFLSNVMRHSGLILHNAQMYETSLKRSAILEKINNFGQSILSELNVDKLVPRVLRELKGIMNVSRIVMVYTDDQNQDINISFTLDEEWMIKEFGNLSDDNWCQIVMDTNQTLLKQDYKETEEWVWNLYAEGYKSFLGIPLKSGHSRGVVGLYVMESSFFTPEDIRFITTFSNYLASALSNASLFSEIREREKTRTEQLAVAKKFQSDRIPYFYEQGKLEFECSLIPAMELAGDFFDVFSLGPKSVGVVIGDVATKGIPASLMTFSILSLFRNAAKSLTPPNKVLQTVNQGLITQIKEQSWFATAFYARIHTDDLTMTYSKAGHVLPILFRRATGECILLDTGGIPLGVLEDGHFQTGQIKLNEDDRLILYTDGVTELRVNQKEMFGMDRLIKVIETHGSETVADLKEAIFDELEQTGDTRFQRDDILVAVLGIKSDPWINRSIRYSQTGDLITEILDQMKHYNLQKNALYAIRLSLNETLANAHKHGNRGDVSKDIKVNYLITDEMFSLSVRDDGDGFDHEALPDPTVEENLLLPHGRGIFLMRSMMDEIEFSDSGNSIKVTKYISTEYLNADDGVSVYEPVTAG